MSKLYIVATPIGNLEDMTFRAVRILQEVDFVLCEDTRVTRKLLDHYKIKTPTIAYHQHSDNVRTDKLINLLKDGRDLALVTDAGTPGISDPGGRLVAEAIKNNFEVLAVPGPSSLTAAISVSGLPMDKFTFLGFLPHKKGRQTLLRQIADSKYPVVLFESVHRIAKLIGELNNLENFGSRQMVIGRELTKKFETVYRGSLDEIAISLKPEEIKGEFVVIINRE